MPVELPDPSPSRGAVTLQFVALGIVWGASFLFIKIALEGLSPAQLVWGRLVLGTLTLGLFMLIRRERLPSFRGQGRRVWGHMTVLSVTFCVVPFLLFAWAEQYLPSSMGSIYNATTPIMTSVMAGILFRVERLRLAQIMGIIVGVAGVVTIMLPVNGLDLTQNVIAQLALLGATTCYGFSLAYMRRFVPRSGMSPLAFSFVNIGLAGVIMVLLTPAVSVTPIQLSPEIVVSVLLLGCVGTGMAYIWNQNTLRAWGPTAASTVTYITPVVGVSLGVLVLGEQLSWHEPIGALIVFVGILLAQDRLRFLQRGSFSSVSAKTTSGADA